MSPFVSLIARDIDVVVEGVSIVFAIIVIYKLKRVDFLFNQTFRNPLHYFTAGMAAIMLAMMWELISQHLISIGTAWPLDVRDVLLAVGITLASVAAYKLSDLLHPNIPEK